MKTTQELEKELQEAKEANRKIETSKEEKKKKQQLQKQIQDEKNKHNTFMKIMDGIVFALFGGKK